MGAEANTPNNVKHIEADLEAENRINLTSPVYQN
jgi:hypothetical protein